MEYFEFYSWMDEENGWEIKENKREKSPYEMA
jgi:hypothetical protein